MKRLFIHNPFFRIGAPPIHGILVYFLVLLVNNNVDRIGASFSNQEVYVTIVLSGVVLESLRLLASRARRRFHWRTERQEWIAQIALSLAGTLLVVIGGVAAYYRWAEGFTVTWSELQMFVYIYAFSALLYDVLVISNEYLIRENTRQLQAEQRLREKVDADFTSFRHDINPVLLYESLETLLLTLHAQPEQAEEQIDLLAGIYRYQLMNRNKELVTLEEELRALEMLRCLLVFGGKNLAVKTSADLELNTHVVPGSMLVAFDVMVRNTLSSPTLPLAVHIYPEDDEYFVMHHVLNDRLVVHEESLRSFSRLQRAYSFFSDKPFVQVKAGLDNYVKFPFIRLQEFQDTTAAT